jgi:hypothetical protein
MRLFALLAPAMLAAAGCSSDNPENGEVVPQPVSGKVLYDGKPAAGVVVTLIPTDAPMVPRIPRNPSGVTGADGTFAITTFAEGDGAAEGGYQVVLTWPGEPDDKAEGEAKEDVDRLKGWYDIKHSTLTVRIKAEANQLPTYKLPKVVAPPPASEGIPGRN